MPVDGSTPVSCFKQSFELYEQLSEAVHGWDLDFRQLGRSNRPFELEQLVSPRMFYGRAHFDCPFYQMGGPLAGYRTFALQTGSCTGFNWCGQSITRQSLIIFPAGSDFESNTRQGFEVFMLSIKEALLERTAHLHYQRPLSDFLGTGREVCNGSPDTVSKIRSMLCALSAGIGRWSASDSCAPCGAQISALEESLAELILQCLDRGQVKSTAVKRSKRMAALGTALDVIENTPMDLIHLPYVLERVDVSRRTLEHAFQDRFDISPAAYIKALQLKALNKALLYGDKRELTVKELCQQHGFHHLGQLANDYDNLFGELPSVTLRRQAV